MKFLRKISALALAAATLFTGCAGGNTSWAFRSGDNELPVGLYMLYQFDSFYDANEQIQKEADEAFEYSYLEPQEILKKNIEGKSASDWIAEQAQKKMREHIAITDKFAELGLEFTEAETASIDRSVASLNESASKAFYSDNGISEKSMREYYSNSIKNSRVFSELYGEGGSHEVPVQELENYLKSNYVMVNIFLMYRPQEGSEDWEKTDTEVKAKTEAYLKRLEAGEEIEDLYYELELDNADEDAKALVQKPPKGSYSMIVSEKDRENFGDELINSFMALETGKPAMIEDPECYILAVRMDIMEDNSVFENYRNTLLYDMKYDEYIKNVAEWALLKQIEPNNAAINRYRPDKINFKSLDV